jgi:hypothetical protein
VTSLVFYDKISGSGDENLLITGSWDKVGYPLVPLSLMKRHFSDIPAKTIKIWDTDVSICYLSCGTGSDISPGLFKTKTMISSTLAHSDFVKTLLVMPSLQLLVSASSDKSVRFWLVP